MNRSSFTAAFKYQLRDFVIGLLPFFAVVTVVMFSSIIVAQSNSSEITFSGFGLTSAICMLVYGIVSPRPNLRLCIQFGVSRRTAFLSQLLAAVISCALLALGGELLVSAGQAVAGRSTGLFLSDIYQMLYLGENSVMTLGQHALSGAFNFFMTLALFALGMFFTCVFWRLSKFWTVVAAVSIPLLLNVVPALCYQLCLRSQAVSGFFKALGGQLASSVWSVAMLFVLITAFFTVISWLLVRHANIRAPQGK